MTTSFAQDYSIAAPTTVIPSTTHLDPNADLDSIFDCTIFDQPNNFASNPSNQLGDSWSASGQALPDSNHAAAAHPSPKPSSDASGESYSTTSRSSRKRGRPAITQEEGDAPPVKKTRQRKKKKQPSKEEAEHKRKKFLERNRLAASKCRSKRKDWTMALERSSNELMLTHNKLVAEFEALKAERDCLKTQLMMHKSCNDGPVQTWLQMEAERAVESLRGSQPMSRNNSVSLDGNNVSRGGSMDFGTRSPSMMFSPTTRNYSTSAATHRQGSSMQQLPGGPASQAMSRSASNSSAASGVFSKRDSGISDMDFPTPPNIKAELSADEGYVTSSKSRADSFADPGYAPMNFQSPTFPIPAQMGPYYHQATASPGGVINPAEFLSLEVLS